MPTAFTAQRLKQISRPLGNANSKRVLLELSSGYRVGVICDIYTRVPLLIVFESF